MSFFSYGKNNFCFKSYFNYIIIWSRNPFFKFAYLLLVYTTGYHFSKFCFFVSSITELTIAMITFLIVKFPIFFYSFSIACTFIRSRQSIRRICRWVYQLVFSFFPLLLLLFANFLVYAISFLLSIRSVWDISLSRTLYFSSFPSFLHSFCKPAGRKRPTLLSRHCLSEQTAWSCLRAKWGRLMRQ